MPGMMSAFRRFNLFLVRGYGIHSSVFPSAHVSSAFSAAWAVLLFVPAHRKFGWAILIYAFSVSLATVYGRYHYAVDAVAGLGISLVALAVGIWIRRRSTRPALRRARGPACWLAPVLPRPSPVPRPASPPQPPPPPPT